MACSACHSQRGISLIESLAAMVILSLGAAVALTWFIGSTERLAKLRQEEAQLLLQLDALDYIRTINPSTTPQGQIVFAGKSLIWKSVPLTETIRSMNQQGADGPFELKLYLVDVQLRELDSAKAAEANANSNVSFQLKIAGYQKLETTGIGDFLAGKVKP